MTDEEEWAVLFLIAMAEALYLAAPLFGVSS
jgi:hypothetical protein